MGEFAMNAPELINCRIDESLTDTGEFLGTCWRDPSASTLPYVPADLHRAEVEALRAELAEMTRRRDEWRKKAEGYDAVRLALREKVGTPWPPHLSRVLWAGIAADEKKRADDAEADREAAVKRALEAAAEKCAERALYIEDCVKWGGSKTYITSLKGGIIELANVGPLIRALASDPEALRRIVEGGE
jgi:hypothetical protein